MIGFRYFFLFALLGSAVFTSISSTAQKPNLSPKVVRWASVLSAADAMQLGHATGFEGRATTNNRCCKLYRKLATQATEAELVLLTDHSSAKLRLYAFNALAERESAQLKSIFIRHLTDSAEVWISGGCTGFIARVNVEMLSQFRPIKSLPDRMTGEEYEFYKAEIRRLQPDWLESN